MARATPRPPSLRSCYQKSIVDAIHAGASRFGATVSTVVPLLRRTPSAAPADFEAAAQITPTD